MMEGERDTYRQFQEWCLRTYGDSGKTKTVTRRKYERIVQLLDGCESAGDNAKFKFWVRSKGFQLGGEHRLLYVPVKAAEGVGMEEVTLRQVAVVEDFYDIIYSMHVESGSNGEKTRKHAGQKRTYKAISETYAFLPREAVTRFLMSCSECQKRMHLNPEGAEQKENSKPPTLVTNIIDYNMPITMAYMKHMRLQLLSNQKDEQEDSSLDSEEFDTSDSTRLSAVNSDLSSTQEERSGSPQTAPAQPEDEPVEVTKGAVQEGNGSLCTDPEYPVNMNDAPPLTNSRSRPVESVMDVKSPAAHSPLSPDSGRNGTVRVGERAQQHGGGTLAEVERQEPDVETDTCSVPPVTSHPSPADPEGSQALVCNSETWSAAKRIRLETPQQNEALSPDQSDAATLPAPAFPVPTAQEVLYINGNGTYGCHSNGLPSLPEAAGGGPTDLSMKKQLSGSPGGGSRPQLNLSEVNAVRQLIAGYRESAAFLLRSADELENIILQQN